MKFAYWFTTVLFAFIMGSSGVGYLAELPKQIVVLTHLGYPVYTRYLLGVSILAGTMMICIPTSLRIKEWVYAGFTFLFCAAVFSHIVSGDLFIDYRKPVLLMILLVVSYFAFLRTHLPVGEEKKGEEKKV